MVKKETEHILAVAAVIGLLALGLVSMTSNAGVTGAVSGSSADYEKCLANGKKPGADRGKYSYGKWDWEWVSRCRAFVLSYEQVGGNDVPRYESSKGAYKAFLDTDSKTSQERGYLKR
jgi:hypothetical protein